MRPTREVAARNAVVPPLPSLVEMTLQKLQYPAVRIISRRRIVFDPMTKHASPRLEARRIERMVDPRIHNMLDSRTSGAPTRKEPGAVFGWCPVVESTNEYEHGYSRPRTRVLARGIERNS